MLPLALVLPASSSLPCVVSVRSPACAAVMPASDTPTLFSVPTSLMRFAYMPSNWLTSINTSGAVPLPAIGVAASVS